MSDHVLTPLDIYRVLEQSNCRRCQLPSCLAFAAAVVAGSKKLVDCPLLDSATAARLSKSLKTRVELEPDQAEFIDRLEKNIGSLNLRELAPVLGGRYVADKLIISSLGKDFFVDAAGQVTSECHIIPWLKAPLLSYIVNPVHQDITGNWISFRELNGGKEWQNLFTSRCEHVLKDIADEHPDLFTDLIELFKGQASSALQADISLILYPLPHFPILICYQAPDADLESELTLFFDSCCGVNLHIKAIFTLCSGLVQMFAKIAKIHS